MADDDAHKPLVPAQASTTCGALPTSTSRPEGRRGVLFTRSRLIGLFLGQVLSLLIVGTSICSSILSDRGVSIPTTQSALNYLLLCLYLFFRKGKLQRPWWAYLGIALVDVEANYLVVRAYRDTSITSVTLLDCFAIPCAMALSYMALGSR